MLYLEADQSSTHFFYKNHQFLSQMCGSYLKEVQALLRTMVQRGYDTMVIIFYDLDQNCGFFAFVHFQKNLGEISGKGLGKNTQFCSENTETTL